LPVVAAMLAAGGLAGGILMANHQRAIAQRRFVEVLSQSVSDYFATHIAFCFWQQIGAWGAPVDARNLMS
jgi:hypothetical protein